MLTPVHREFLRQQEEEGAYETRAERISNGIRMLGVVMQKARLCILIVVLTLASTVAFTCLGFTFLTTTGKITFTAAGPDGIVGTADDACTLPRGATIPRWTDIAIVRIPGVNARTLWYSFEGNWATEEEKAVRAAFTIWNNRTAKAPNVRGSAWSRAIQVKSIAVHEIGHSIGLHHPCKGASTSADPANLDAQEKDAEGVAITPCATFANNNPTNVPTKVDLTTIFHAGKIAIRADRRLGRNWPLGIGSSVSESVMIPGYGICHSWLILPGLNGVLNSLKPAQSDDIRTHIIHCGPDGLLSSTPPARSDDIKIPGVTVITPGADGTLQTNVAGDDVKLPVVYAGPDKALQTACAGDDISNVNEECFALSQDDRAGLRFLETGNDNTVGGGDDFQYRFAEGKDVVKVLPGGDGVISTRAAGDDSIDGTGVINLGTNGILDTTTPKDNDVIQIQAQPGKELCTSILPGSDDEKNAAGTAILPGANNIMDTVEVAPHIRLYRENPPHVTGGSWNPATRKLSIGDEDVWGKMVGGVELTLGAEDPHDPRIATILHADIFVAPPERGPETTIRRGGCCFTEEIQATCAK